MRGARFGRSRLALSALVISSALIAHVPAVHAQVVDPAPPSTDLPVTEPAGTEPPESEAAGTSSTETDTSATETYIVIMEQEAVDAVADPTEIVEDVIADDAALVADLTDTIPVVATELTSEEVAALEQDPRVLAVLPNLPVSSMTSQSRATWGLDRIDQRGRPTDRRYSYPDSAGDDVDIYIVDSGIRPSHREFTGRITSQISTLVVDIDPITEEPVFDLDTRDCNGHGTHVAGTAAGTSWGVAKRANIIPVRVFDCSGSGYFLSIIYAIVEILERSGDSDRPAVVNFSLGVDLSGDLPEDMTREELVDEYNFFAELLTDAGITVVAAAGNEGADACLSWPASAPSAITVGATTSSDSLASFSNRGTCVDILAPGVSITSASHTSDSRSTTMSGTSMAAPHVAGAAALVLSEDPTLTPAEVADALIDDASLGRISGVPGSTPNRLLFVPSLTFSASSVPPAIVGSRYRHTLQAQGGRAPYSFSVTGLPPGLSVSGSQISGTATSRGEYPVTVSVTDADGSVVSGVEMTFAVNPPAPGRFSRTTIKDRTQSASLSTTLTWSPSANADYYEICVNTQQSCPGWTRVDGTSYAVPSLAPATKYFWQVRAVNPTRTADSSGRWWSFTTAG